MQNSEKILSLIKKNFYSDSIELIEVGEWAIDDMYEYGKDVNFYKYMEGESFNTRNDAKKYISLWREKIEQGVGFLWMIVLKKEGRAIGSISLFDIDFKRMSVGYGYGLSLKYSGKGYLEKGLKIIFNFLFVQCHFHRVHGLISVKNIPSALMAHKFGFKQDGVLRDYYRYSEKEWDNAIIVSLLDYEYKSNND